MPVLPSSQLTSVKKFPVQILTKRCIGDDCDDDNSVSPAVPIVIVVVVVAIIIFFIGYLYFRRRRNGEGASPWSSSYGGRNRGGFGLMGMAWRALSSRGGDSTAGPPSQTWPGQGSVSQTQLAGGPGFSVTENPNVTPYQRGRDPVYRPHSKTVSQLGAPPAYMETDPDPQSTEAGLAQINERSQSRGREEARDPSTSSSSEWGRSRSTNQQRQGGSGRAELLEQ